MAETLCTVLCAFSVHNDNGMCWWIIWHLVNIIACLLYAQIQLFSLFLHCVSHFILVSQFSFSLFCFRVTDAKQCIKRYAPIYCDRTNTCHKLVSYERTNTITSSSSSSTTKHNVMQHTFFFDFLFSFSLSFSIFERIHKHSLKSLWNANTVGTRTHKRLYCDR